MSFNHLLVQISVDELDSSISVKIGREAVMNINSPESLFSSVGGMMETKVYIAGLPNRTNIIKPVSSPLQPSGTQSPGIHQYSILISLVLVHMI